MIKSSVRTGIVLGMCLLSSTAFSDNKISNNVYEMELHISNNSPYTLVKNSDILEGGEWAAERKLPEYIIFYRKANAAASPHRLTRYLVSKTEFSVETQESKIGTCSLYAENHIKNAPISEIKCTVSTPYHIYTDKRIITGYPKNIFDFSVSHREVL